MTPLLQRAEKRELLPSAYHTVDENIRLGTLDTARRGGGVGRSTHKWATSVPRTKPFGYAGNPSEHVLLQKQDSRCQCICACILCVSHTSRNYEDNLYWKIYITFFFPSFFLLSQPTQWERVYIEKQSFMYSKKCPGP